MEDTYVQNMSSSSDSCDISVTDSEEGGDDSENELSQQGTTTTVKFQTVKQESFQRTETGKHPGSIGLLKQIMETCEPFNQDVIQSSKTRDMVDECDMSATGGTRVIQQSNIQVQQKFDVTVHGGENLSVGGTLHVCKPGPSCKEESYTEKLLNRTLSRITEWTQGMTKTAALEKVLNKLNQGTQWITIEGSPGEGKTTVAYMALKELHSSGRQVFQVTSSEEFSKVTECCPDPVLMLDDIFGNLAFDQAEWLKWKPVLHQVLDVMEHRSDEEEQKSRKNVTLIVVGRNYILNSAVCNMGRISDYFTQEPHVVSLTSERIFPEKLAIVKAISMSKGIELEQNMLSVICHSICLCPHGFPHVCRLFLTFHKSDPTITAEEFFKSPFEFLNQTIIKFTQDQPKLSLFKEMLKGNGRVSVRELGQLDKGSHTILSAYDLVGTYLRKVDDYFIFDHPSVYDCVAYNVGRLYPLFVIEHCNLSFICERLKLQLSHEARYQNFRQGLDFVVGIPRSYIKDLARRFATEISNRNLLQVLSHESFRDDEFIDEFMSQLSISRTELMTLTERNTGEHFLSVLASSKSRHVLKYLEQRMDIKLTQDDINQVFHGVCKYAAHDILNYLLETRSSLCINIKFGDRKLTPLMIAAKTQNSQFLEKIMSLNPDLQARDRYGKTVFHYLCENGQVDAVKELINRGTDVDVTEICGWSPLVSAIRRNQTHVVRLLIDSGARLDAEAVGETCRVGKLEIVKWLFDSGATVNMESSLGMPFHLACVGGHVKVINFLIEKGASVNTPDKSGWYPLHSACLCNKPQAVQCLIDHGAVTNSRDSKGYTPLHTAAESGSHSCLGILLAAAAEVNAQTEDKFSPLHISVTKGSKACVEALIEAGANVDALSKGGYTPLHKAAEIGCEQYVPLLVKAGADVNVQSKVDSTPLHKASETGSEECVDILLKAGANVNAQKKNGQTPLHQAAWKGSKGCVGALLKAGADVNVHSNKGYTALHMASRGSTECVNLLMNAKADVNASSKAGCTPLHTAVATRSTERVDVLVKGGGKVNAQKEDGSTPLHQAAEDGSKDCVDMLLAADADVNIKRCDGQTPLHMIVHCRSQLGKLLRPDIALCKTLVTHGADLNIQDSDGNTPLHRLCQVKMDTDIYNGLSCKPAYSYKKLFTKLVALLVAHGTDINIQNNRRQPALHGWCQTLIKTEGSWRDKACALC